MVKQVYKTFTEARETGQKLLAILVDPEKFQIETTSEFLRTLPLDTTHIFVGGSTVPNGLTEQVVDALKLCTSKPVLIFPGDSSQITNSADALLFLSLLSGRNPEYLIGQQVRAVGMLRKIDLEVISTGYLLVDGGSTSAVESVTQTKPMSQNNLQPIIDTAKAGELLGAQLIYLEAGSGAKVPVHPDIIAAVKTELNIPLIVGGGIRTEEAKQKAYAAGADMVVMGTVFET